MDDSKYKEAGVDIDAATDAIDRVKPAIRDTFTPAVLADVGSFGGLFALDDVPERPVLVSSIDGVGTKVKLAADLGRWSGIGYDIVNHCVNDILVQNARPLFFLDYVAASSLRPEQVAEVVSGMAAACKAAGCALIGGETAEMPGVYAAGAFDVVGAIVGMVDRQDILPDKSAMQAGDVLLGLPSSGPHTNGYSLIRQTVSDQDLGQRLSAGPTLGEALLEPHRLYVREIARLRDEHVPVLGLAHITGGGVVDNVPRVLPGHLCAMIERDAWRVPELFRLLIGWSGITETEAFRVFNLGIGMVVIVPKAAVQDACDILPELVRIGFLAERSAGSRQVQFI